MRKFSFFGFLLLVLLLIFNCNIPQGSNDGGSGGSGNKNKSNQPASGDWQWTRVKGGSNDDVPMSMTVDTSGNVYISGYTGSSFDGQTNNGDCDLFLIKYDANANHQWTRLRGGSNFEGGCDLALDSIGNIYITGCTAGSFDGQTNNGDCDVFIIKYDTNGNHQWTRITGGTGNDLMYSFNESINTCIVIDADDNVYVSGYTDSNIFNGVINSGNNDMFIIKYDKNGNYKWAELRGSAQDEIPLDMALDTNNNIYITGITSGGFDGESFNGGNCDTFLVKYGTNGNHQWTRLIGGSDGDYAKGIAIDTSGNVYITGESKSSAIDGQSNNGDYDAFVVKYSVSGNHQWTRLRGGSDDDYVRDIVLDTSGNLYISGHTSSSFDGETNNGDRDAFIIKYDSSGDHLWTRLRGGVNWDLVTTNSITLDTAGNIYVGGITSSSFDGQTNNGYGDIFLIKYDINGSHQWTRVRGSVKGDDLYDLVLGSNSVYITGCTKASFDGQSSNGEDDAFICKFYE